MVSRPPTSITRQCRPRSCIPIRRACRCRRLRREPSISPYAKPVGAMETRPRPLLFRRPMKLSFRRRSLESVRYRRRPRWRSQRWTDKDPPREFPQNPPPTVTCAWNHGGGRSRWSATASGSIHGAGFDDRAHAAYGRSYKPGPRVLQGARRRRQPEDELLIQVKGAIAPASINVCGLADRRRRPRPDSRPWE